MPTWSRVWDARQEPPVKVAQESGVSTPPQVTRPSWEWLDNRYRNIDIDIQGAAYMAK